jgi:glycosyltransferase involved in cell wall biosynthesis
MLLTGSKRANFDVSEWPCDIELLPTQYSWNRHSRNLANAISAYAADVVLIGPMLGAYSAVRYLYHSGQRVPRLMDTIHTDLECEYGRVVAHLDVTTAVGAVSDAIAQRAKSFDDRLRSKVFRLYCPVCCRTAPPKRELGRDRRLRIAFVGVLRQPCKRVLDLIPLTKELLRARVDFSLSVIGDGPEKQHLQHAIFAMADTAHRVTFHGYVKHKQVLRLLEEHDILVLVSDTEGQSFAVLEAMAAGVVPIATDLAAIRDVIQDGKTGHLVAIGDMQAMAARIAEFADSRDRLCEMGAQGWEFVRSTHMSEIAARRLAETLDEVATLPVPPREGVRDVAYGGVMTRLGVPDFVQYWKRRLLQQEIH